MLSYLNNLFGIEPKPKPVESIHIPLPDNVQKNPYDFVVQKILAESSDSYITGSYVYKRLLMANTAGDIDVTVPDTMKFSQRLQEKYNAVPDTSTVFSEPYEYYWKLTMDGVHVDLLNRGEIKRKNKLDTFINTIKFTSDGFQHKRGVKLNADPQTLSDQDKFDQDQMKFVMENLKQGRFCEWGDMRPKDHEYFGKFQKIPQSECEKFFFFPNATLSK